YQKNSPVHPLLSRLQMSLGITFEEREVIVDDVPTIVYSPVLLVKPLIGYYNPYNVELTPPTSWTSTDIYSQIRWGFEPLVSIKVGDNEPVQFYLREMLDDERVTDPQKLQEDIVFNIPREPLLPGETRMYSIDEDINRKVRQDGVAAVEANYFLKTGAVE